MQIISISFIYAIVFGLIETITRQIDIYLFESTLIYSYTTIQQFILTLLWTPILLQHKKIKKDWLRCLLFPINIYFCEICGGNIMYYIFNVRAWHYTCKYAMFNGMIALEYYPLWIIIYFIEHYGYKFLNNL